VLVPTVKSHSYMLFAILGEDYSNELSLHALQNYSVSEVRKMAPLLMNRFMTISLPLWLNSLNILT